MRILSAVAVTTMGVAGCTPDVDPPWLVRRSTELAMRTDVIAQGPWGDRIPADAPRTFHDGLPEDRLRFTPLVVDEDGVVPSAELSTRWVVCQANDCLDALATADELPPCAIDAPYTEVEACAPGDGPALAYTLGPPPGEIDEASLFALAVGPSVAFIGSRLGAPGADACVRALYARTDMTGCVSMLRTVRIGPPSTLLEAAEQSGIEVEVSESVEPLLAVPRNRNPEVERFEVSGSSLGASPTQSVMAGGSIPVSVGDELDIEFLPTADDFDNYSVDVSGETLEVVENLFGRWFYDRPSSRFVQVGLGLSMRIEGSPGPANLYFVLQDGDGSEVWGSLTLDVSDR